MKLYQRGALPDDPPAWLVTVAHNLLRDDRRRAARRDLLLHRQAIDAPAPGPAPSADVELLAAERVSAVRTALDRLSEREQRLLLLRHEGFRYREIASILEIAPGSVGTMLVRATEAFRQAYNALVDASC